mmetsp:Transcript_28467/g.45875  ORF Transcript_28467/g.45875 Transcript_28467/m.45875 type:complete len:784 (+) Transcript_28467:377-2728(+)
MDHSRPPDSPMGPRSPTTGHLSESHTVTLDDLAAMPNIDSTIVEDVPDVQHDDISRIQSKQDSYKAYEAEGESDNGEPLTDQTEPMNGEIISPADLELQGVTAMESKPVLAAKQKSTKKFKKGPRRFFRREKPKSSKPLLGFACTDAEQDADKGRKSLAVSAMNFGSVEPPADEYITVVTDSPETKRKRMVGRKYKTVDEFEFNKKVRAAYTDMTRFVLFPDNPFLVYWDLMILVFISWIVMYVPFQVGVSNGVLMYSHGYYFLFGTILNVFFIADTTMNFFRAYFTEMGRLVFDRRKIVRHYLFGWFWVDCLACFPCDSLYRFLPNESSVDSTTINLIGFINMLRMFRVNRAFRIVKTNRSILEWRMRHFRPQVNLCRAIVLLIVFSHWIACMFCFVALLEAGTFSEEDINNPDNPNWLQYFFDSEDQKVIPVAGNEFKNMFSRYTVALYWSFMTTTSIGYGDIVPVTIGETWYVTICMVMGGVVWAFMIAIVIQTTEEIRRHKRGFHERLNQMNSLVAKFEFGPIDASNENACSKLDTTIARDARLFLHTQYQISLGAMQSGTKVSTASPVLSHLPARLRNRVCLALVRQDLFRVQYMRHPTIDKHTLGGVAALCEILQYNTGEMMYIERNCSSAKRGLFLPRKGVIAMSESNRLHRSHFKVFCGNGVIMRDYAILPRGSNAIPRIVTIAFLTFSEMIFVPRKAIMALFRIHQNAWRDSGRWLALFAYLRYWAKKKLNKEPHHFHTDRIDRYSSDEFNGYGGQSAMSDGTEAARFRRPQNE